MWQCDHGGNNQSRQARAQSEGKNRLFGSEINLYRLFGTIYCRLRRYPVGAHSVRLDSAKSYGSWANTPTRYEPPAAVARWTSTAVGVFAPTVQLVQMNLQTVCRGRTSGHLLLRLCRNSPWHTLRNSLCTPKIFPRVDHSWSIFYIIRRIDEGRSYASQGECSGTSAGVRTTTAAT